MQSRTLQSLPTIPPAPHALRLSLELVPSAIITRGPRLPTNNNHSLSCNSTFQVFHATTSATSLPSWSILDYVKDRINPLSPCPAIGDRSYVPLTAHTYATDCDSLRTEATGYAGCHKLRGWPDALDLGHCHCHLHTCAFTCAAIASAHQFDCRSAHLRPRNFVRPDW